LNIGDFFIEKLTVNDDFDYKVLFSDSRGAAFKEEYKFLISEAVSKKIITVEKYIVAENIQDELCTICETKGLESSLLRRLKNYHNESDYVIAPLIYILKKLDKDFTLSGSDGVLKIDSNMFEVEICPRIDGKNAEPRLFFPKEKVAMTATNDNVVNLVDILAVKGIQVYVIGTDHCSNVIYAYKISRDNSYFDVAESFKENIRFEQFNRVKKYWR